MSARTCVRTCGKVEGNITEPANSRPKQQLSQYNLNQPAQVKLIHYVAPPTYLQTLPSHTGAVTLQEHYL